MPTIIFYRHVRLDGGIRTGIEIDETTVFERFESTGDDHDPALLWYVDVRCESNKLPRDAESARQWLLDHASVIEQGLTTVADELRAGVDIESWPLQRKIPGAPRGVQITIVSSAMRRMQALAIGKVLHGVATHWKQWVARLPAVQPVSR